MPNFLLTASNPEDSDCAATGFLTAWKVLPALSAEMRLNGGIRLG